ncbi:MAG: hypothetical protein WC643_02135 [Parcubacteria group bacterium]|jgi:hypothetical protein
MNELFVQVANFFQTTQGAITVIIVIIGGLWQYWRYVKEWNFTNYHQLIKELNQSDSPGEAIKLYRQVAVVYELRNYPRYYSVSKRILKGWLEEMKNDQNMNMRPLYEEMRLCIEFMDKKILNRLFSKILKK